MACRADRAVYKVKTPDCNWTGPMLGCCAAACFVVQDVADASVLSGTSSGLSQQLRTVIPRKVWAVASHEM